MNRTEIEAKWNTLTPRERDAWVLEVIFGYEQIANRYNGRTGWWRFDSGNGGYKPYPTVDAQPPEFTQDNNAAWAVVENMQREHLFSFVLRRMYCLSDMPYGAEFSSLDGRYRAEAYTASEAICLAAIIAKLTKVSI